MPEEKSLMTAAASGENPCLRMKEKGVCLRREGEVMLKELEKMRKREEARLEKAKRDEFKELAASAMDAKSRHSASILVPPRKSRKSACFYFAFLLFLGIIGVAGAFVFFSGSQSAERHSARVLATEKNVGANAADSSSSGAATSIGAVEKNGDIFETKSPQAFPTPERAAVSMRRSTRVFTPDELKRMPPDVRAEIEGRGR
jgi:hypothetical protein